MSNAIKNFISAHAVGPVEHRSQSIKFDFANGKTGYIVLTSTGGFEGAMAFRGENCLGHFSTLKSFAQESK
jgi:hypothetical protein